MGKEGIAPALRLAVAGLMLMLGIALVPLSSSGAAAPADNLKNWTGVDSDAIKSPGGQVYEQHCAACHESGLNRAPQRINLQGMTPEAIKRVLTDGAMREQGMALSDKQKVEVAEFLSGRKMGASAAPVAYKICKGARARFDLSEPPAFSGWGLDPASTHAIPEKVSGLDRSNAGKLKLKWAFGFPNSVRARSEPSVAGGAIFVSNQNGTVYAFDRDTGCVRWKFDAPSEVRTAIVVSPWRAGDSKAHPLVYFGDVNGNAYAVNMLDGKLVWKVHVDNHPATIITGTPTLYQGTLYVPVSSNEEAFAPSPGYACCSFRGSILALDAATGAEKWRTWLVGKPKVQGTNKAGIEQLGPSGVAVWNSPAIDAKRGQLYVATGDNYSLPGSPLSDAIVAINLTTGRVKWHYQAFAGDTWNVDCITRTGHNCPDTDSPDFDFGAGAVLAKAKDGKQFVLAGQKSGWVYALDPDTGKLAWKTRVGRGSPSGGVHFGLAAENGVLFVPVSDRFVIGSDTFPPSPGLYALDIATGKFVWKAPSVNVCGSKPLCGEGYGGGLTATDGLVLIGGDDGHLRIYDAKSGKVLWDRDTTRTFKTVDGVVAHGGAISGGAAPIAYKGDLIVPSGYGFASKMPGNVLLVYGVK